MQKLIFVYNANSGIGNTILDVAHKIFSPKTYNCNLCAITFNTFSENKTWKDFRTQSDVTIEFLHIDEFEEKHENTSFNYPVILAESNTNLEMFLSAEMIKKITSTETLISILKTKLGQAPH